MKHQLLFIVFLNLSLVGCIAKPRGTYYQPFHPLGQSFSRSCDHNSNKERIEIPIIEGVLLQSSLIEEKTGTFVLSISFVLEEGKSIRLLSDNISVQINGNKPMIYSLKEWQDGVLVGGVVKQNYHEMILTYNKSFGEKVNIGANIGDTLKIEVPEVEISSGRIKLAPIEFKKMSGEVQWLPKLNC